MMNAIFSDGLFWIAIAFIVIGIVLFKLVDRSFTSQKKKLENPQKNFEKFQREMYQKGFRVRSHTIWGRIAPAFITAMGIIMLIMTVIKY